MADPIAARPAVAVVGSLNADLVLPVDALPQGGQTVLTSAPGRQYFGGKGANQAAAAAAFGAAVTMTGRVGDDESGRLILADLNGRGVDTAGVLLTAGARTGFAAIAVDAAGENLIIVDPGANQLLTSEDVAAAGLGAAAVTLVQLEIPLPTVAAAMRATGGLVILNPAPAPAAALPAAIVELADVIVPNLGELSRLAASAPDLAGPAELMAVARLARSLPGHGDVVVTLGREGALVVRRDDERAAHIPAPTVTSVDTTGAGDCFCGTLAASLAAGLDLVEAARWSVAAAALSTTEHGARGRLPVRAEVVPMTAVLTPIVRFLA